MAKRDRPKVKPVKIGGISFDALLDETVNYNTTVPTYNVEDGFPVSDAMIREPLSISMTVYLTDTPVSFRHQKGHHVSCNRVQKTIKKIEEMWKAQKPVKIVTTNRIYKDMAITSLGISHTPEMGYARQISISAQKIRITKKKVTDIPSDVLKSGTTKASSGSAATSTTSSTSTSASTDSEESTSSTFSETVASATSAATSTSILGSILGNLGYSNLVGGGESTVHTESNHYAWKG